VITISKHALGSENSQRWSACTHKLQVVCLPTNYVFSRTHGTGHCGPNGAHASRSSWSTRCGSATAGIRPRFFPHWLVKSRVKPNLEPRGCLPQACLVIQTYLLISSTPHTSATRCEHAQLDVHARASSSPRTGRNRKTPRRNSHSRKISKTYVHLLNAYS
jgi:hypothetical protein